VVRRSILEQGAVHELVVADEPLDRALRDFLRRRQRFA
jgi:ribosomal protein S21